MKLKDFSFELPEHLIAKYPTENRAESRLLHLNGISGQTSHRQFKDMLDLEKRLSEAGIKGGQTSADDELSRILGK